MCLHGDFFLIYSERQREQIQKQQNSITITLSDTNSIYHRGADVFPVSLLHLVHREVRKSWRWGLFRSERGRGSPGTLTGNLPHAAM